MTLHEHCRLILESGDLCDKLRPPLSADGQPLADEPAARLRLDQPARCSELAMVSGATPLPPLTRMGDPAARIQCLARFAHHELMAVELFAWALVTWPEMPAEMRRGFARVMIEEQQHFQLYLDRLRTMGADLSGGNHSGYLWRHAPAIRDGGLGPAGFLSAMGLTFEQANLDHTLLYRDHFRAAGDEDGATLLQRVHDDEVGHLRFALTWHRRLKPAGWSDLETYERTTPFPLGAARARGRLFDEPGRRAAGLDDEFISYVEAARSPLKGSAGGAWLLPNVGADRALAAIIPGGQPAPDRGPLAPAARRVASLWALLFGGASRVLPDGHGFAWPTDLGALPVGPALPGLEQHGGVVPWIVTPAAIAEIRQRSLRPAGSAPESVRRVHDKAFALTTAIARGLVPASLLGLLHALEPDELLATDAVAAVTARIASWPAWTRGRFTLKPRYSNSGRGRTGGALSHTEAGVTVTPPITRRGLRRLAQSGGAILEPWLERDVDLSAQLRIDPDGKSHVIATTRQVVSPAGVSHGNRGTISADGTVLADTIWDAALADAARQAGEAAAAAGFRGYLGVDAFVFREGDGGLTLRPIVEINARFTVGTVALGLLARARDAGLVAGDMAWCLLVSPEPQLPPVTEAVRVVALGTGAEAVPGQPLLLLARHTADLDVWLRDMG